MDTTEQGMVVGRVEFGGGEFLPDVLDRMYPQAPTEREMRALAMLRGIVDEWEKDIPTRLCGLNAEIARAREFLAQKT